jgi:hypothetical protein
MKEYDTGMSTAMTSAIVIAVIVVSGLFVATIYYPGVIPTTTPTTPTTIPNGGFGIRAADYLESRQGDISFYWIYNSSFVNTDLTTFYNQSQPGAFVDGVIMRQTTEGADIEVLFAPWDANIVGNGTLDTTQWTNLENSVVTALEGFSDTTYPDLDNWYPTFNFGVYFNDGTFFSMQYWESGGVLDLSNGTWDGFSSHGFPNDTSYDPTSHWLLANGLLEGPISNFYTVITENVPYPSQ